MDWIKEGFKLLFRFFGKSPKEFERYNNLLVLGRIRLISLGTILMSVNFAYMDYKIFERIGRAVYFNTLVIMHVICVMASVIFLLLYNWIIGKNGKKNDRIICHVPRVYFFLYILFGVLSSINSQRYNGNIYSYIILVLIAAIVFTVSPLYMLLVIAINHGVFLIGLSILSKDAGSFLTKQTNSTTLVGVAILFGLIFYRYRLKEFVIRKELKENVDNFKKLFYSNPYPVIITRMEDGKIIEASKRACSLMGLEENSIDGYNSSNMYMKDGNRLELLEELKENSSTYNRIVEYEFMGKRMWVTANYELIDYHGEKCILTGIMDITEIRKAEEELSLYASTDVLTGIMNRRMGLKKLEELMEESKKDKVEFVLCFLDINNLKQVNDTFGHGEGDKYIINFCNKIKMTVGEKDLFFRMGGDEFIIVFLNKALSEVEKICMEFNLGYQEISSLQITPYKITASHGLFYYCSGMEVDLEQIIEHADKQMYMEKQKFRKSPFL